MIYQSFLLGNVVSLCMKIINSVVVVGLYYGFLTTFSTGPSYLSLLRAQVMEEEEGAEKRVSATTGFIMGQLMMFISIYYTPLHLALGRPHTITVLVLPYLLFHFFWNNHQHFFYYGSTSSIRNLSILCVFLNNLIFPLFNHFSLPSSMLARLVNIYMFRCNNKMLFVTSSFVGWLIGQILFIKWVGLVLVWLQKTRSIRSKMNKHILYYKYLVSRLRKSMARIFSILFFITCVYYLGRMPSPIFTNKLTETSARKESEEETDETKEEETSARKEEETSARKEEETSETKEEETSETKEEETSETKEEENSETKEEETSARKESEEETDVKIEKTSETKETKQEEEGFTDEDPSPSLFSEEKEDPDKIDEREKIRVNGKDKTKDEFHKNSPTSYSGNQDISKLEILQEEEDKNFFVFDKPLLSLLFDYQRWNRPTRYIKNNRFENPTKNEMSQYFFNTCQNDGKQRISFTYPPSLSIFWEMLHRNLSLSPIWDMMPGYLSFSPYDSTYDDELYNYWIDTNEQKKNSLRNEFDNRIKRIGIKAKGLFFGIFRFNKFTFNKGFIFIKAKRLRYSDVLEKKTRLCKEQAKKDKSKNKYLAKIRDPLLNGFYRGIINNSSSILLNETSVNTIRVKDNPTDGYYDNRISSLFQNSPYCHELEQKLEAKIAKEHAAEYVNEEDYVNEILKKESIGLQEIGKKVPHSSYKLIDELQELEGETKAAHQIRSRLAKRVVIFTDIEDPEDPEEMAVMRYLDQPDFRRDLVKGSMRVQRRKTVIWKLYQPYIHSPLFFDRLRKFSFFFVNLSRKIKRIFRNSIEIEKKSEFPISNSKEEKIKQRIKRNEDEIELEKRRERARLEIADAWDAAGYAQVLRGLILVTHSILRKYILFPLLIIAKNIVRVLLFQRPEWSEDLKDWKGEIYVKCTYNGVPLSETEFPINWLTEGIQIKILFPFRLKPWHRSRIGSSHQNQRKKKEEKSKSDFCFLTVWGMETEVPFGSPRKSPSFVKPILKELKKKIQKVSKIRIPKEKLKSFLKVSNEIKNQIISFFNKIGKEPSIINPISEIKKEKDSIINNQMIDELAIQDQVMNWPKYSVRETKMEDLANRTRTIRNQIEKMKEDKKKTIDINNGLKGLKSRKNIGEIVKRVKKIGQIVNRLNERLIRKSPYLLNFFIERIYVDLFLYSINLTRIYTQLFLESTKKLLGKSISNTEGNQERIDKKKKNTIPFLSTRKKALLRFSSNKNSKIASDFSFLSQAYVFYKLSQAPIINLAKLRSKLRSVLQYHGTSLFLKKEIKDSLETQGISHYELRTKKRTNSGLNQWKNWLKNNYQYKLSEIKWSLLVPQKWRKRVNEHFRFEKQKFQKKWKSDEYEKEQLINYKNANNSQDPLLLLPDKKLLLEKNDANFKKNYRYDLLSYKFIYYEDKKDSHSSAFPRKKNQEVYNTSNHNILIYIDIWWSIFIPHYFGKTNIMDIKKNPDRKYLDWQILTFRAELDSSTSIYKNKNKKTKPTENKNTEPTKNTNTDTKPTKSKIFQKMENRGIFYRKIYPEIERSHQKRNLFDWMGMNDEILNGPIPNMEFWFFPEFAGLYKAYKMNPWVIPIDFLFSNFNERKNLSENKNVNRKKTKNPFRSSNKKKSRKLEKQNKDKKELVAQGPIRSDVEKNSDSALAKQQKAIEKGKVDMKSEKGDMEFDRGDMESDQKARRKKKKPKTSRETELDFFLKRFFIFQFKWKYRFAEKKMLNNIHTYSLLVRLPNLKKIVLASVDRKEMRLDIMKIDRNVPQKEVLKKRGLLILEPIRLGKVDRKFLLYQTLNIPLVHKGKPQNNQKKDKENVAKNNFDLLAPENILSSRRRRELRILTCFNSNSRNNSGVDKNLPFCNDNRVKSCSQFFAESKNLGRDKNQLIKLKFFLWPNYRLEDLACMNRYWFDTNNGSRFSILRIHMYPRLKTNF